MNRKEIFNYLMNEFNKKGINYVILHSYQKLPEQFDSDIDIAIKVSHIKDAIQLLDNTLKGTGWQVIQFWRHEYCAADCVISNDKEFLQVDFCIDYERNGRILISIDKLLENKQKYNNFYIPNPISEFVYILVKKILKKFFSDVSKEHLSDIWNKIDQNEKDKIKNSLTQFLSKESINSILLNIENNNYKNIDLDKINKELLKKSSNIKTNMQYMFFDSIRKLDRIIHPTGMFIVLLGVDGAGKTTIANELMRRYKTAFRRMKHYHSRVRVLNDISQIRSNSKPIDVSNPHAKKRKSGKILSIIKFGYYYLDYLIGNIIITKAKIQSSLVLVERYYYDYYIDKVRYNLNLSDKFLKFFGCFIKKPDVIFILTGNSKILLERKNEITLEEINQQKDKVQSLFKNDSKVVYIDTTKNNIDESINDMLKKCNNIMRGRRKW